MIADYQSEDRSHLLGAPRQYGIKQAHKHLPEMSKITGLKNLPLFSPIVADFYSGMEVTVPLFKSQLSSGGSEEIKNVYRELYNTELVSFTDSSDEEGFLSAAAKSGKDSMQIEVYGNDDRIVEPELEIVACVKGEMHLLSGDRRVTRPSVLLSVRAVGHKVMEV